MKIYRGVRSNVLTQPFGVNRAFVKLGTNGIPIRPFIVSGSLNGKCPEGYIPFYKALKMKGHNGIDFATWRSEPVYHCADFDGWIRTEIDGDGGIGIDIISLEPLLVCKETGKKEYIKMRYWHGLKNQWHGQDIPTFRHITLYKDFVVKMGEIVALSNNSGASSGNHLHKGLKWCDKNGNGIQGGNGYRGAIDINDMFENKFVLDVVQVKTEALSVIQLARKVLFIAQQYIKDISRLSNNQ